MSRLALGLLGAISATCAGRESENGNPGALSPELATAARSSQRRASEAQASEAPSISRHRNYGRVPSYLRERQLEMAQDFVDKQAGALMSAALLSALQP